jgi:hypothetical protein
LRKRYLVTETEVVHGDGNDRARSAPGAGRQQRMEPAPQTSWTVHSASRILGGPIENPIPRRARRSVRLTDR